MKIGILCAGDDELAPFLPLIKGCCVTEKAMLKFYTGRINGIDVAALFSGVCKVNAAIASQLLIDLFGVDAIINAGTAGGMAPDLDVFDTVISTEACYHDVAPDILTEFHPWMDSLSFPADPGLIRLSRSAVAGMSPVGKVVWGRMATGEPFYHPSPPGENLRGTRPPDGGYGNRSHRPCLLRQYHPLSRDPLHHRHRTAQRRGAF